VEPCESEKTSLASSPSGVANGSGEVALDMTGVLSSVMGSSATTICSRKALRPSGGAPSKIPLSGESSQMPTEADAQGNSEGRPLDGEGEPVGEGNGKRVLSSSTSLEEVETEVRSAEV
jgi:hypothetical protein